MDSEDPSLQAEISGLRAELAGLDRRLHTSMLHLELRMARRWSVAIFLATLALCAVFLRALLARY